MPSDKAGEFVNRIAAVGHSMRGLSTLIWTMYWVLPQDEHFPTRLTALFEKANVGSRSYGRDHIVVQFFSQHPDVLAGPLVDFVRQDPSALRQSRGLNKIFGVHAGSIFSYLPLYPSESQDQKVCALRAASEEIDTLRGPSSRCAVIVEQTVAYAAQRTPF